MDEIIQEAILSRYPDCGISIPRCRDIKEHNSFVSGARDAVMAPVMIRSRLRRLNVAEAIDRGCTELLKNVFQGVELLIKRADPNSIPNLLRNIFITGGNSRIPGFSNGLQNLLEEAGFEECRVIEAGTDCKGLIALGASVAARQAKEGQWQNLLR